MATTNEMTELARYILSDISLIYLGLVDLAESASSIAYLLCNSAITPGAEIVSEISRMVGCYAREEGYEDPESAAKTAKALVEGAIKKMADVRFITNPANAMKCGECGRNKCFNRANGYGLPCGEARCVVCQYAEEKWFEEEQFEEEEE